MFEEIKKEHTVIIDNLVNMKKLNIHTKEGQLGLLSAKNDILTHIKMRMKISILFSKRRLRLIVN